MIERMPYIFLYWKQDLASTRRISDLWSPIKTIKGRICAFWVSFVFRCFTSILVEHRSFGRSLSTSFDLNTESSFLNLVGWLCRWCRDWWDTFNAQSTDRDLLPRPAGRLVLRRLSASSIAVLSDWVINVFRLMGMRFRLALQIVLPDAYVVWSC